jgi:LacI family transcriptional regulator, galactose operon repressor
LQPAKPETPTLLTVARLANVSIASASRVLNGIRTNPETLERVTAAAEAVGYAPNAAARSLRSNRTGQIAFAMPDVANPVYTTMVSSIQQVARAHGVRLLLHSTDGDIEDELALLRDLKQRYVDGVILVSLRFTEAHVDAIARAAVPVALLGRPLKGARVDTVRANSRRGAVDAVRHLHAVGRSRIAFINGPEATTPGSARRLGYLHGLRACGLARAGDALVEVADDFTLEPGREAAERLLARARPDAIFCANDLLALGAIGALRAAGLDVPGDVAVVGMDNTSLTTISIPSLTSVDLGSAERGKIAAELLLERIDHPTRRPRVASVEPRLVVRASSGAGA